MLRWSCVNGFYIEDEMEYNLFDFSRRHFDSMTDHLRFK